MEEVRSNKAPSRTSSVGTATSDPEVLQTNTEKTVQENQKGKKIKLVLTFLGLQLSLFLAALDGTIVSTALPHIGSDFNEMAIVAWVATAYIVTFDAFQPLFSKFSDIFGRKWILVFGISLFLLASVLCGAAKSMIMLIVFRAIAGIGAAAIFSMVFVIISELVPLEKRGSYQGLVNAVFALSSVFGPLIGGSFTDYVTWRWNFYINLPIGAAALLVLILFLQLPTPKDKFTEKLKRIDYVGTALVLAFATLFLLALNFGGQMFPWKSAAVIVPLVLAGILVAVLVIVEVKFAKEPLMPPHLFKNRSVVSVLLTNIFFGIVFFAMIYYLPIYFQVVRGDSAMWSGIRMIPMQMIICVFSTASGLFISKTGIYRPLLGIGMGLITLCVGLISMFGLETSWSRIYGFTIIGGMGMGCMFSASIIALQASVAPKDLAVVTGLGNFARILGGALGVAIASAALNSSLQQDLPNAIPHDLADMVISSSEFVRRGLPSQYLDVTLRTYIEGLQLIWHVMIPMAAIGFISAFFLKHHEMRRPKPGAAQPESQKEEVVVEVPSSATGQDDKQVSRPSEK
ncbi:hypothetical protein EC973_009173 [Apophysomyces ossiformis]|uniref:Major facilitator superfamily (MFS) profile domain-containing protein n=1 Tax=Apophysomyces ossiformis TaxID=679940 RepID=A0A8H7EPA5_9FUNG|nr:hypothetical protein EC973_009173 [Apophysomyces ossiformis]